MRTTQFYEERRAKVAKLIAGAIQSEQLEFRILVEAVDILGFDDGPTMWTAVDVGAHLAEVPLQRLKFLLEKGTDTLQRLIHKERERTTHWMDQRGADIAERLHKDPATLTVGEVREASRHHWSELVCVAIALQSISWALMPPIRRTLEPSHSHVPCSPSLAQDDSIKTPEHRSRHTDAPPGWSEGTGIR